VAAARVPVAVRAAAAADGGGSKKTMTSEGIMKTKSSFGALVAASIILAVAAFVPHTASAQDQPATNSAAAKPATDSTTAKPASSSTATSATQGAMAFDTPQQAADAVVKAATDYDVPQLMKIFGPDGKDFITGGDQVQDKTAGMDFAKLAAEKMSISTDKSNPNKATIIAGNNDWPMPVPLVKRNGKWYFDSKSGRQEILYRRVGANELDAITVCRGYVEAQKEYALTPRDGINQYAQKIISTPGKQDGLYWKNEDGTSGGPIGEEVAEAIEKGYNYNNVKQGGFHGYYFKILKGQGPDAPIGRINYVIEGVMIGGFALVAVPAEYRITGVKTFIVSNDGIVYEKDLGPNSLEIAKQMELYNPDKTWKPTDDGWPESVEEAAGAPATSSQQ